MEQFSNGLLSSERKDFRRWQDLAISLQAWTDKKEEYVALLLQMKR